MLTIIGLGVGKTGQTIAQGFYYGTKNKDNNKECWEDGFLIRVGRTLGADNLGILIKPGYFFASNLKFSLNGLFCQIALF